MSMDLVALSEHVGQKLYREGKIDLRELLELAKARMAFRQGREEKPARRSKKQGVLQRAARIHRQAPRQQAGFSTVSQLYAWGPQGEKVVEMMRSWPSKGRVGATSTTGFGSMVEAPIMLWVGKPNGVPYTGHPNFIIPGLPRIVEQYLARGGKLDGISVEKLGKLPPLPKYLQGRNPPLDKWTVKAQTGSFRSLLSEWSDGAKQARINGPIQLGYDSPKDAWVWLTSDDGSFPFDTTLLATVIASVDGPPVRLMMKPAPNIVNGRNAAPVAAYVTVIGQTGAKALLTGKNKG